MGGYGQSPWPWVASQGFHPGRKKIPCLFLHGQTYILSCKHHPKAILHPDHVNDRASQRQEWQVAGCIYVIRDCLMDSPCSVPFPQHGQDILIPALESEYFPHLSPSLVISSRASVYSYSLLNLRYQMLMSKPQQSHPSQRLMVQEFSALKVSTNSNCKSSISPNLGRNWKLYWFCRNI